ncbi:hypothetical protein VF13_39820 [Nostoc linckia z16]|nr:hypothetical protein VF13_39820 [Nostoc linckia z16]
MAVTAIILSVVYVIISVTTQRLHDFEMQNEFTGDMNRLSYSINKVISESETMLLKEGRLVFNSYDGKVSEFKGADKYMIRAEGNFTDTFRLPFPQMHIDTLMGKRPDMQYQRLNLKIAMQGQQEFTYAFYKKIYVCSLLKEKEYYEH